MRYPEFENFVQLLAKTNAPLLGLPIRHLAAIAAMQGMLANPNVQGTGFNKARLVGAAREAADALLAELEKEAP